MIKQPHPLATTTSQKPVCSSKPLLKHLYSISRRAVHVPIVPKRVNTGSGGLPADCDKVTANILSFCVIANTCCVHLSKPVDVEVTQVMLTLNHKTDLPPDRVGSPAKTVTTTVSKSVSFGCLKNVDSKWRLRYLYTQEIVTCASCTVIFGA